MTPWVRDPQSWNPSWRRCSLSENPVWRLGPARVGSPCGRPGPGPAPRLHEPQAGSPAGVRVCARAQRPADRGRRGSPRPGLRPRGGGAGGVLGRAGPVSSSATRAASPRKCCPSTSSTATWRASCGSSTCVSAQRRAREWVRGTWRARGTVQPHAPLRRRFSEGGEHRAGRPAQAGARPRRVPAPELRPRPRATSGARAAQGGAAFRSRQPRVEALRRLQVPEDSALTVPSPAGARAAQRRRPLAPRGPGPAAGRGAGFAGSAGDHRGAAAGAQAVRGRGREGAGREKGRRGERRSRRRAGVPDSSFLPPVSVPPPRQTG